MGTIMKIHSEILLVCLLVTGLSCTSKDSDNSGSAGDGKMDPNESGIHEQSGDGILVSGALNLEGFDTVPNGVKVFKIRQN